MAIYAGCEVCGANIDPCRTRRGHPRHRHAAWVQPLRDGFLFYRDPYDEPLSEATRMRMELAIRNSMSIAKLGSPFIP